MYSVSTWHYCHYYLVDGSISALDTVFRILRRYASVLLFPVLVLIVPFPEKMKQLSRELPGDQEVPVEKVSFFVFHLISLILIYTGHWVECAFFSFGSSLLFLYFHVIHCWFRWPVLWPPFMLVWQRWRSWWVPPWTRRSPRSTECSREPSTSRERSVLNSNTVYFYCGCCLLSCLVNWKAVCAQELTAYAYLLIRLTRRVIVLYNILHELVSKSLISSSVSHFIHSIFHSFIVYSLQEEGEHDALEHYHWEKQRWTLNF